MWQPLTPAPRGAPREKGSGVLTGAPWTRETQALWLGSTFKPRQGAALPAGACAMSTGEERGVGQRKSALLREGDILVYGMC